MTRKIYQWMLMGLMGARTTTGSHVTLYNQSHYGSVYKETMGEYFPN